MDFTKVDRNLLKLALFFLLVLLLLLTIGSVRYFLNPIKVAKLNENQLFKFGKYTLMIEKVVAGFCPQDQNFDCSGEFTEAGVQIRYTTTENPGINYEYLGLRYKPSVEIKGLKMRVLEVDLSKKSATLEFAKI